MAVCVSSCTLYGEDAGDYVAGVEYPDGLAERYPRHFRRTVEESAPESEEAESGKLRKSGGNKR